MNSNLQQKVNANVTDISVHGHACCLATIETPLRHNLRHNSTIDQTAHYSDSKQAYADSAEKSIQQNW